MRNGKPAGILSAAEIEAMRAKLRAFDADSPGSDAQVDSAYECTKALGDALVHLDALTPPPDEVDAEALGRATRVAVKGADIMAGDEAIARGLTVRSYPADWSRGRQAGPERNQHMLDVEHVEPHRIARCFAFSWILVGMYISPGTSDMVSRCLDAGIACTIIPPGARP